jgi:hypothetical protein
VLALATRGAAQILGIGADRGTLAPGKVADVVVVSGTRARAWPPALAPSSWWCGGACSTAGADERLETLAPPSTTLPRRARAPIEVAPPDSPPGPSSCAAWSRC